MNALSIYRKGTSSIILQRVKQLFSKGFATQRNDRDSSPLASVSTKKPTTHTTSSAQWTKKNHVYDHVFYSRIIDKRYYLAEMIAQGSLGNIYKARDLDNNKNVAIRVIHHHLINSNKMREWFKNTAEPSLIINHPKVVKVLEATYSYDGTAYVVMELIDGINLAQLLAQEKRLALSRIREFVKQICAALHAAHLKNIIHGDLNPNSIIVLNDCEPGDQLKTGNFFLHNQLVRKIIGTKQKSEFHIPFYDAPEYLHGERVDYRADIYSLGVLVYFMLTGELPFQSTSPINYLLQTLQAAPRSLKALDNDIPKAIEDVVLRSLAKNPTYRQQTALQFANEFDCAISNF